jgi:hypothetical protein
MKSKNVCFYASPTGSNAWNGKSPTNPKSGQNGPLRTLAEVQKRLRALRADGPLQGDVYVYLRGGRYELKKPWTISDKESGVAAADNPKRRTTEDRSLTYCAYKDEKPVISGGRLIKGFREGTHNGQRTWTTTIPDVAKGKWSFQQLWVNGERRHRPRLPREGLYHIKKLVAEPRDSSWNRGDDRFIFSGKQFKEKWHNLKDVEVSVFNYWIDSRMKISSVNEKTKMVSFDRKSGTYLMSARGRKRGAPFWIENVFEELKVPGDWYLDRVSGTLYYLPLPQETLNSAEIVAPNIEQLLLIEGKDLDTRPAACIRFQGITFSHTHTEYPFEEADKAQAACNVPAAISVSHARRIAFDDCSIINVGNYGLEFAESTRDAAVRGSTISDLGAGGIRIWHGCTRTEVSDCTVSDGGHIFHRAVGVLIGKSSGNRIVHNHIHTFDYTGVSVGWCWGYQESGAYGNVIEYNHIHSIGHGLLSDMGGIYLLGVATGTRLRYNLIHDVESRHYGGWGIYTDEGSSHVLIENNVVHSCQGSFDQHYGKDNIVKNNVFCLGSETQMRRLRPEAHASFIFTHNIVYFREGTVWAGSIPEKGAVINHNIYFNPDRSDMDFGGRSFEAWQKLGQDKNSLIANPRLRNPEAGDFRLAKSSPALRMGFVQFSCDTAGPRAVEDRDHLTEDIMVHDLATANLPIG